MSRRWKSRALMEYDVYRKKRSLGKLFELLLALSFILLFMGSLNRIILFTEKNKKPIEERINSAVTITETYHGIQKVRVTRFSHRFEIQTQESSGTYIVDSISSKFFAYQSFVNHMEPGMPITLLASSTQTESGNRSVYAVSSENNTFLSRQGAIRAHEANDRLGVIMGWPCIVSGLLLCSVLFLIVRPRLLQ